MFEDTGSLRETVCTSIFRYSFCHQYVAPSLAFMFATTVQRKVNKKRNKKEMKDTNLYLK